MFLKNAPTKAYKNQPFQEECFFLPGGMSMSVSMVLLCGFGSDLEDGHDDEFQGTLTEILPPKGGEQSDLDGCGQLRRFRKM